MGAFFVLLTAILIKIGLVTIVTAINAEPLDAMPFANLVFLMFQRPVFVIAGALGFTPIMLGNPFTWPISAFLKHSFFFPLARLSYGAYLSHGVFMLFRTFNMERGMWADELDSFFLFMAYLSFAYLFSFLITVIVEMPCHNMYQSFVIGTKAYYMRAPATSANIGGRKGASQMQRKVSEDDDQSDAETLDTIDHDSPSDTAAFISTSAAYKKSKKLMLDPPSALDNDSYNSSVSSSNDSLTG